MRTIRRGAVSSRAGFSILEVLIAAILLLVVFGGLAGTYMRGRRQMGYEEDRRRATALAQSVLDGLRRTSYDALPARNGTTSVTVVEGKPYTLTLAIAAESPQPNATLVTTTVTWNARTESTTVSRSIICTTILGRGLPPPAPGPGEATHPVDDGVNHDES